MAEISKFNVGGTVYDFQDKVSQYGNRNLARGSLAIAYNSANGYYWAWNGATPELVTLNGETVLHASQTTAATTVPSIALNKSVNLEGGKTYIYSAEIMTDAIQDGYSGTTPLHFHVGSVEKPETIYILNKGGGVVITRLTPTSAPNTPAKSWQKYVYKITTNKTAPDSKYPYPVIRPFIYGTAASSATIKEVGVRRVQITLGNKLIDGTPAPQDLVTVSNEQLNFFG